MKAILVIDMPNDCWECPMHIDGFDDENEEIMVCNAKARESHYGEKPSWCPLMPMPMKKASLEKWFAEGGTYLYTYNPNDYDKGWNECVEVIEK